MTSLSKSRQVLITILTTLISSLLSLMLAYSLAENFFFDKLFYQKSILHGYWRKGLALEAFGERSKDLVALRKLKNEAVGGLASKTLGVQDANKKDNVYTIAVIGDSYAFGVGVRYKLTTTQVLEKKLNADSKTRVLNFGNSGDSILDYLARYNDVSRFFDVDLYIFMLGVNDTLLNADNRLPGNDFQGIVKQCAMKFPKSVMYFVPNTMYGLSETGYKRLQEEIELRRVSSCFSRANMCVVDQALARLPNDPSSTIYFITDDYVGDDPCWQKYREFLNKWGLNVIASRRGEDLPSYSKYWSGNPRKKFSVSAKELHPSRLAHRMYADILYTEITQNSQYGFGSIK